MQKAQKHTAGMLAPNQFEHGDISCYERLANAIIAQACRDYFDAYESGNKRELVSLERFFHSDWCALLTKLDTDWLMRQIRQNKMKGRLGEL